MWGLPVFSTSEIHPQTLKNPTGSTEEAKFLSWQLMGTENEFHLILFHTLFDPAAMSRGTLLQTSAGSSGAV